MGYEISILVCNVDCIGLPQNDMIRTFSISILVCNVDCIKGLAMPEISVSDFNPRMQCRLHLISQNSTCRIVYFNPRMQCRLHRQKQTKYRHYILYLIAIYIYIKVTKAILYIRIYKKHLIFTYGI